MVLAADVELMATHLDSGVAARGFVAHLSRPPSSLLASVSCGVVQPALQSGVDAGGQGTELIDGVSVLGPRRDAGGSECSVQGQAALVAGGDEVAEALGGVGRRQQAVGVLPGGRRPGAFRRVGGLGVDEGLRRVVVKGDAHVGLLQQRVNVQGESPR
ncbi:hypothetical protein [Streptomyces sp. NPDC003015]